MFNNKKIHLIGIGGISMSAIAILLKKENAIITGSNNENNNIIKDLKKKKIKISIGHKKENITPEIDIIIYTQAIGDNNIELLMAKKLNLKIYERSEFLGLISKSYKKRICISGTHGKSTTTGLAALSFLEGNKNPTIHIGAILSEINGNIHIGSNDYLIMEACEYKNSFLNFFPTDILITNIELDHPDYFNDINDMINSYQKYINLLSDYGNLIINNDDINILKLNLLNKNYYTYGINNNSTFRAKNIEYNEYGYPTFNIYYKNKFLITINLNIPGLHNIYNSLAVFALSYLHNINILDIKKGLEKYTGVERRFEYVGKYNDCLVYDDYAHHPTEILTTFNTVKNYNKNNFIVFQPHTYSRTKKFLNEFSEILSKFDNIIIAPIYSAREINIFDINENTLVNLIKKYNKNVLYLDSFNKISDYLKINLTNNDILVTVGAGNINEVAKNIVNN